MTRTLEAPVDVLTHKLPPHNLEAEQSILGAILLENHAIETAAEMITPDDFYKEAHRRIYTAMLDLSASLEPIEIITLPEILRKREELGGVGGLAYLTMLLNAVPNAANIKYHCKIVREKALLRALIHTATDAITKAYMEPENVEEFLSEAEGKVFQIAEKRIIAANSYSALSDAVNAAYENLSDRHEKGLSITGLRTGYKQFDEKLSGLQNGDLIIVAGRPSMGKTAWALNIAANIAVGKQKESQSGLFDEEEKFEPKPVAFFSIEMSKEQLALRAMSFVGRVDSHRMKTPKEMTQNDFDRLTRAATIIKNRPLYIFDQPTLTPMQVRMQGRRLKRERGLALIIIDYLQLMRDDTQADKRAEEIGNITRSLKQIAKELDCPVIALSQLNREIHKRADITPGLADLKDSGSIEQDADVIAFTHYPYMLDRVKYGRNDAKVIIGKQRNGPIGEVKMTFIPEFTLFREA